MFIWLFEYLPVFPVISGVPFTIAVSCIPAKLDPTYPIPIFPYADGMFIPTILYGTSDIRLPLMRITLIALVAVRPAGFVNIELPESATPAYALPIPRTLAPTPICDGSAISEAFTPDTHK